MSAIMFVLLMILRIGIPLALLLVVGTLLEKRWMQNGEVR